MDLIFLFVVTVWKMRQAQIKYFTQGRRFPDLVDAKRYEKLVDEELKKRLMFVGEVPVALTGNDLLDDEPKQANLFTEADDETKVQ